MTRTSDIVYVVARLEHARRAYVLFHAHAKWGDWGLVGGHVEAWEKDNWDAAAARETGEEMSPLHVDIDVALEPLTSELIEWGPEPSRSAGGAPTIYRTRWYSLRFLRDPVACLNALDVAQFLLVDEQRVAEGHDDDLSNLLQRLGTRPRSLSWAEPVDFSELRVPVRRYESQPLSARG